METEIITGDCLNVLPTLKASGFDAVVTDPPYELGFMGKSWDATGIAYSVDLWREVLRVLKPGGHLLAFGGTRTYHRMTCAIEDAGFEVRDSLHWIYGTGFPKSLNVGEGRGTALKPGHEPIVLARKPLEGTVAGNVEAWGTGALNIDACRIATNDDLNGDRKGASMFSGLKGTGEAYSPPQGRWPANVLFDEDAAAELDAQSGTLKSGAWNGKRNTRKTKNTFSAFEGGDESPRAASQGGASRFFYVAKPSKAERGKANTHPTVKPIQLMRYLVRLVTPADGVVLDPFTGSGTTGIAATLEGRGFVGIEQSAEYARIARRRIAAAQGPLFERSAHAG